jgi:hypothetical protein
LQSEQALREIERAKHEVRDRIWALLEREGAAVPPGIVVGKIPTSSGLKPPPSSPQRCRCGRPPKW